MRYVRRSSVAGLFSVFLLLISAHSGAATSITSIEASPNPAAPGDSVTVTGTYNTDARVSISYTAVVELKLNGNLIAQIPDEDVIAVTAGTGSLDPVQIPLPLTTTPGTYELVISASGLEDPGIQDGGHPFSTSSTLSFEVKDPALPVTFQPQTLTLEGRPGDQVVGSFSVSSGNGPFVLSTTVGELSAHSADVGQTLTYKFTIPASATPGSQLSDSIVATPTLGNAAMLPVTISVTDGSIQPPTQGEIDESMQSIAFTQPQKSTASVISTICPAGVAGDRLQQDCNVLVGGSFVSKEEASQALGQVTTDQASAPVDAAQTSIQSQVRNIGTRITALRGGITGFSARGLTLNLDGETLPIGTLVSELANDLAGIRGGGAGDAGPVFGRWGFFVNGALSSGDKDRTESTAGFDFDSVSITLGTDYRFQDNLIGGIALGYVQNETEIDSNGGDLDADGINLSLYGTYYSTNGLYLDGIVTYGWRDYDQKRNIRYDIGPVTVDQSASADFDGSEWSLSFGGGYAFAKGPLSYGPTLRVEYLDTSVDSYQERMLNPDAAGGGWATSINDQDVSSFTSQLGGEISYAVSTSWGVLLPNAYVEWVHEFEDGANNVVGHFVQDPTRTQFSLRTDNPDTDYFNLRLGLSLQLAEGRAGYIYYRKLLGYSDLDAYTIEAGIRLEF